jgi:hypothetical protein
LPKVSERIVVITPIVRSYPDKGNGSGEWLVVVILPLLAARLRVVALEPHPWPWPGNELGSWSGVTGSGRYMIIEEGSWHSI